MLIFPSSVYQLNLSLSISPQFFAQQDVRTSGTILVDMRIELSELLQGALVRHTRYQCLQRSCRTSRVSNPQFALPTRGETRLSHLAVMAVNSMLGFTRHELHNSSLLRVKPSRTVMVNEFEFEFFFGVLAVTSLNSASKHNDFTVFLVV